MIEGNDLPGEDFDYDFKVKLNGVNPAYTSTYIKPKPTFIATKPVLKKWQAIVILLFGVICFGMGVGFGRGAPQESVSETSRVVTTVTPSPVIVTKTQAVPSVPGSCMLAFEKLTAMQGDLEIIIDSSKTQIQIGNKAYVAIVARKVEEITKTTGEQYELNRSTSSASLQLQIELMDLQNLLTQCKVDLGR